MSWERGWQLAGRNFRRGLKSLGCSLEISVYYGNYFNVPLDLMPRVEVVFSIGPIAVADFPKASKDSALIPCNGGQNVWLGIFEFIYIDHKNLIMK